MSSLPFLVGSARDAPCGASIRGTSSTPSSSICCSLSAVPLPQDGEGDLERDCDRDLDREADPAPSVALRPVAGVPNPFIMSLKEALPAPPGGLAYAKTPHPIGLPPRLALPLPPPAIMPGYAPGVGYPGGTLGGPVFSWVTFPL